MPPLVNSRVEQTATDCSERDGGGHQHIGVRHGSRQGHLRRRVPGGPYPPDLVDRQGHRLVVIEIRPFGKAVHERSESAPRCLELTCMQVGAPRVLHHLAPAALTGGSKHLGGGQDIRSKYTVMSLAPGGPQPITTHIAHDLLRSTIPARPGYLPPTGLPGSCRPGTSGRARSWWWPLAQNAASDVRGQILTNVLPTTRLSGIGPMKRESSESVRLSPMTK